jgi:hypothetical protein
LFCSDISLPRRSRGSNSSNASAEFLNISAIYLCAWVSNILP